MNLELLIQLISSIAVPIISKLIDKFVPDKVTRKRDFKMKRRIVDGLNRYHGKTLEQIARAGKREENNNGDGHSG